MTKNLVWRLKTPPTVKEVKELVETGVLTKDEAREILFTTEEQKAEDTKALKSEINFLRELVEKLSSKVNYYPQVWTTINTKPYERWPWYPTYFNAMGSGTSFTSNAGALSDRVDAVQAVNLNAANSNSTLEVAAAPLNLPRYEFK